jgi:hypothetical protein
MAQAEKTKEKAKDRHPERTRLTLAASMTESRLEWPLFEVFLRGKRDRSRD